MRNRVEPDMPLRYTESQPEQPMSPAQNRVTPEELSKAIAAIETRKQEEARLLEGTVLIGDAIQALELELTPEEVLEEVEAQRHIYKGDECLGAQHPPARRQWKTSLMVLWAVSATGLLLWAGISHLTPRPNHRPVHPSQSVIQPSSSLDVTDTIAAIPNGRPFYCLPSEVEEIIQHESLSKIVVITTPALSRYAPWTLIKHHGNVYLRGWISQPSKHALLLTGTAEIYNFDPETTSVPGLVPITLRVGSFEYMGFYTRLVTLLAPNQVHQTNQMLTVVNAHLDKYAWEKW